MRRGDINSKANHILDSLKGEGLSSKERARVASAMARLAKEDVTDDSADDLVDEMAGA